MIHFYKYQGTGNDFVMVDGRDGLFNLSTEAIAAICDRRFGVGADGLIVLLPDEEYDFKMLYHNADGKEGSMCGNGGRCTVQFAHDLGIIRENTNFIAADGPHEAIVHATEIALKMINVSAMKIENGDHFYHTGSPHVVKHVSELDNHDVYHEGKNIRYSDYWKERGGTNVNFVEKVDLYRIKVRTYERGVEDETYSCGTGVTACALDVFDQNIGNNTINISTKGGDLKVQFEQESNGTFSNIWLIGPAKKVFEGDI